MALFFACFAAESLSDALNEGLSVWMACPRLELFDGTAIVSVAVPFIVVQASAAVVAVIGPPL